jgi:hypothetical protein
MRQQQIAVNRVSIQRTAWHGEGAMPQMFLKMLAIALLISSASYGQSLGEIARENREKKAENASTAPPKVITNQTLPTDPGANEGSSEAPPVASAAASSQDAAGSGRRLADLRVAEQHLAEEQRAQQRTAEQWKRQILAQKNRMATLQARIDQLHASIQSANGDVQSEGPYNRYQARQLERVAQIQQQLDAQKRKLDQMQDAARHAGMHTAVYDP